MQYKIENGQGRTQNQAASFYMFTTHSTIFQLYRGGAINRRTDNTVAKRKSANNDIQNIKQKLKG
jgi:hypothetical protein